MTDKNFGKEPLELFAAANSGHGFHSFYRELFGNERVEKRYLIKGGPGTGKSSFMRRVANAASERGLSVEYYRCSSDPTSLDAIVIDGKIAVIDSTAPHVLEPELVGARDEIVNLGSFWNSKLLEENFSEIERLSAEKSARYNAAYRYLESALALDRRFFEIAEPYVKRDKMLRAVEKLLQKIPDGEKYTYRTGVRSSVGMKGRHSLDYYERAAEHIYIIEDFMSLGSRFLALVANGAVKKNNKILVSYDPINLENPDALLFEDSGIAFLICREEEVLEERGKIVGKINMKRFLSQSSLKGANGRRARTEYKNCGRMREALISSACEQLELAGEAHFELEKIYGRSMDFDALSHFCESFSEMICGKLK